MDRTEPGDAYALVAGHTRPILEMDAARGVRVAQLVLPHFNRDWAKPNVMTKLYNVTVYGASNQHHEKLKELGMTGEELYDSARYLATVVLQGVTAAFPGAMAIMETIESAARAVMSKYPDRTLEWVSPIGLPVVQPYRRRKSIVVYASQQRISYEAEGKNDPAKRGKQVSGSPPNVIHCFDASHKAEVALACRRADIDFMDVHDNFWAHAGHMEQANPIYRDEFIRLHEADPLADILRQWATLYPEANLPPLPAKGQLDLREIRDATYFFN